MKLTRLPFTVSMLVALVMLGIYGQTHVGPLDVDVHQSAGYSTELLFAGHLHRLLTSLFFTAGGSRFYASLIMFAGAVGWVEWFHGTRRAACIFFGVHLLTLLIVSIAITYPLAALETVQGHLLYSARDVGPSAGYYGCLGFAIAGWADHRRPYVASCVVFLMLMRLAWSGLHLPATAHTLDADLAHAVAFPLGFAIGREMIRMNRAGHRATHSSASPISD